MLINSSLRACHRPSKYAQTFLISCLPIEPSSRLGKSKINTLSMRTRTLTYWLISFWMSTAFLPWRRATRDRSAPWSLAEKLPRSEFISKGHFVILLYIGQILKVLFGRAVVTFSMVFRAFFNLSRLYFGVNASLVSEIGSKAAWKRDGESNKVKQILFLAQDNIGG